MTQRTAAILSADVVQATAMMERDGEGALARLKRLRHEVVQPAIAGRRGRAFKVMGDGLLAEFPAPGAAVAAAVEIQRSLASGAGRAAGGAEIALRIGVHRGAAIPDGLDLYGDAVNGASRLQALARPGGVAVSGPAWAGAGGLQLRPRDGGMQALRGFSRPVRVLFIDGPETTPAGPAARQRIYSVKGGGGAEIAWTRHGDGPPLLRAGHYLTHMHHDWENPVWRPTLDLMGARFRVVRYDMRGSGLSERRVPDMSLDRYVEDMAAVADAAGLERFPVLALSQGVAVALRFAARFPERVTAMAFWGGFARSRLARGDPAAEAEAEALLGLIRVGWGAHGSPFLKAFTAMFMPDATPAQVDGFVETQRACADVDGAVRVREAIHRFDGLDAAAALNLPLLIAHAERDAVAPLAEAQLIAERVPGAALVRFDSDSHVLLPQNANWAALDLMLDFLAAHG
ncbi:alpha/beta fold hydrolase [Rhodovulum sp. DZ06]|uniref:alpha/beta fold hydrolase n=1 Tax=Rhodovulum sp. DZ06 TaxID=3425126 RepID=UPI003D32A5B7